MGTDGRGWGGRGRHRKRDRNRVEDGLEKIQPDHDVQCRQSAVLQKSYPM